MAVSEGEPAKALTLWTGLPLAEFAEEQWARPHVVRLVERRAAARERHVAQLLALDDVNGAVAEAESLCQEEPLRELAHALLMEALARAGRASESLRVFDRFRKAVVHRTGLEPSGALAQMERRVLDGRAEPRTYVNHVPTPGALRAEADELIGRDREVEAVEALLVTARVVTLTGPGGVGKSRLAQHGALRARGRFVDDVLVVDLSAVAVGGSVAEFVAGYLGTNIGAQASSLDAIVGKLAGQHRLLLLESCEHVVVDVANLVSAISASCPGITVLCTSREVLGVSSERVFRVTPLAADASALFDVRARAARHNFVLSAAVQPVVEEICAALDGLPLAIELAAARCDRLTLFEIRSQLTERFALLTHGPRDAPQRHRSLGEVIDWSWTLLSDVEQLLLARLSVFRDGWSGDAAEAVCGFGGIDLGAVRALTGALVRKSLVVASLDGDHARYRLLDSVRAFAGARLETFGATHEATSRHAAWALALLERIAALLRSPREIDGASLRDQELANLNAALDWTFDNASVDQSTEWVRVVASIDGGAGQFRPLTRLWRHDSWPSCPADHPNAGYVALFQLHEIGARDPTATVEHALALARRTDLPLRLRVAALEFGCLVPGMFWRFDVSDCLSAIRDLVGESNDPLHLAALASAEASALPSGSAEQRVWLEAGLQHQIVLGVPTSIALARYVIGAQRAFGGNPDDAAFSLLSDARSQFEAVRNHFWVAFTDTVLEFVRPGSSRLSDLAMLLRQGAAQGPIWFLQGAANMAELLATNGRTESAAVIAGALRAAEDAGTTVLRLGPTSAVDLAVSERPAAFERGRRLSVEDATALLLSELEAVIAALGK